MLIRSCSRRWRCTPSRWSCVGTGSGCRRPWGGRRPRRLPTLYRRGPSAGGLARSVPTPGVDKFDGGRASAWADYDEDGDLDLVVIGHPALAYFRNDGTRFAERTQAAGLVLPDGGIGVQTADYDNDGDADCVRDAGWVVWRRRERALPKRWSGRLCRCDGSVGYGRSGVELLRGVERLSTATAISTSTWLTARARLGTRPMCSIAIGVTVPLPMWRKPLGWRTRGRR